MSQQMKVTLVGAKSTDWKSEDGRHYDHVTLFALIPMDTSGGNAVGQGAAEFKWQDSRNLVLDQIHLVSRRHTPFFVNPHI